MGQPSPIHSQLKCAFKLMSITQSSGHHQDYLFNFSHRRKHTENAFAGLWIVSRCASLNSTIFPTFSKALSESDYSK